MTLVRSHDDLVWMIELSALLGAIETRREDTRARCSVCDESVELVSDRVPILTSSGTASTWRRRAPYTHSRECYEAAKARAAEAAKRTRLDLWER